MQTNEWKIKTTHISLCTIKSFIYPTECTIFNILLKEFDFAFSWINRRLDNIKMHGTTVKKKAYVLFVQRTHNKENTLETGAFILSCMQPEDGFIQPQLINS
jgi:hypothetical protein